MILEFYKYQATGNDFILVDNRKNAFPAKDVELIQKLCHRNFGIGADGLMLLETSDKCDFKMVYFNADGKPGTMCGNGGRCITAFAKKLGIIEDRAVFEASDGIHHATISDDLVRLGMRDVNRVEKHDGYIFLDTGSPHHVTFYENLSGIDIYNEGKKIRYGKPYFETGTNVNFVAPEGENKFRVRTYERGVENETLSCGTGVTAVALAADTLNLIEGSKVTLKTEGGLLKVDFERNTEGYTNIHLSGPATFVFKGKMELL